MGKKSNKSNKPNNSNEEIDVPEEIVDSVPKTAWEPDSEDQKSVEDDVKEENNSTNEDEDEYDEDEYDDDFDNSNLGELLDNYFVDDKNRNLVDIGVEIKRCFEKQNVLLKRLVEHLINK